MTTPGIGQLYQTIFEGAFQFTGLLDPEGLLLETNPASLAFCCAKRADVLGKPFWETPWWTGTLVEQQRLREAIREAAGGQMVRYEVDLPNAGGGLTTLDFSLSPVRDRTGNVVHLIAEGRDITDRRKSEMALQDMLARYQAVLASTLDPVITIDGYGIIQSASRSVERVFGYQPEELVGQNISILMPQPHHARHDGYLASYRSTGQTHILGKTREFEAVRKDGSRLPIELSVSRVDVPGQQLPLFTGIIHDISERKQAEREIGLLQSLSLSISEATSVQSALHLTLQTICETAGWDYGEAWLPEMILDGEHLYPALTWARDGSGFERVQKASSDVRFPAGRGLPGRVWEARTMLWLNDLPALAKEEFTRRDDAIACGITSVVGIPILTEDDPVAVLLFFVRQNGDDLSRLLDLVTAAVAPLGNAIRRKQAEDELERHHQQLEQLIEERTRQLDASHEQLRLADRLAAIGTLAAGLGHDMNNVLLPVRCRLDALEGAELTPEMREQFQAVRRSVSYLQQLSDGLHLLALDPEDDDASEGSTDIQEWWAQVGTLLRKAVPKQVAFEVDLPAELPPVAVPPHRLTQAVLNLVVNAGEAIEGRGRVLFWAKATGDGRVVRIGVTDDGIGMTEEVKRRALDPFFTTKTRGLGTGLGLSLVRGVVQGAGGSVAIDSEPGKGTTVTINLPAEAPPTSEGEGEDGLCASVILSDPRVTSFVGALLTSGGVRVENTAMQHGMHSDIWVTEHSAETLKAARTYLRKKGRQVVVLGHAPTQWTKLGAIIVDEPEDFEEVRQAISDAVSAAAGED